MKITAELIAGKPCKGIVEEQTGKVLVPHKYFTIQTIDNHLNLSMNKVTPVFKLYETPEDLISKVSRFCTITNNEVYISTQKYSGITAFYQGLTIACLEEEYFLIDLKENRLSSSADKISILEEEIGDDYPEVLACLSGGLENYGYEMFIDDECFDTFFKVWGTWSVACELAVLRNDFFIGYIRHVYLGYPLNFNYADGLCLHQKDDKMAFVNRYCIPVCEPFDYLFSDKDLRLNGIENNDPAVKYIERDGKVLKIKFSGDFVNELIFQPHLFFAIPWVMDYFNHHNKKNPHLLVTETENKFYFKIDEFVFRNNGVRDKKYNHLKSEFLKFISLINAHKGLTKEVQKHNDLFGPIFSTSYTLEVLFSLKKDKTLIPVQHKGKWGFTTSNFFPKLVIPTQFDAVVRFTDELYNVKVGEEWKQIDLNSYPDEC